MSDTQSPEEVIEEITPSAILGRLAAHIAGNPFATDKRTVQVGAAGRKLQTALQQYRSLVDQCNRANADLVKVAESALAVLVGESKP